MASSVSSGGLLGLWGGGYRGWELCEPSPGWLRWGSNAQAVVAVGWADVHLADLRFLSPGSSTKRWRRLEIAIAKTGEMSALGKPSGALGLR